MGISENKNKFDLNNNYNYYTLNPNNNSGSPAKTANAFTSVEKTAGSDKKKIKLNVDSPKFTAKIMNVNPLQNLNSSKENINENFTLNPITNIVNKNLFNKFDEFDPSA